MTDNARTLTDKELGLDQDAASRASAKAKPLSDSDLGFEPPARGLKGWGRDIAATAVKGAIAVPEALVGLADIPTGGRVGKFLENEGGAVGFRPKQAKEQVNEWHSDATKEAQRKFQQADGLWDKAAVAVQNPSLIATAVGESLPSMGAGGVAARGLLAGTRLGQMGAKGAVLAGATGEGLTMAGSQAEAIRQETSDGLLNPTQAGLAVATGLAGGALGAAGGKVAQRLGIGDADTMLAQGMKGVDDQIATAAARAAENPLMVDAAVKSIPRKVIEGAIAEGFLEELPQSMAEQIFQNIALDKPWHEDLDSAAVMGVLSGGAMGAGAAGFRGFRESRAKPGDAPTPEPTPEQGADPADGNAASARNPGLSRVSDEFAARLQALQEQEQGEPMVPQTAPPDGAAALAQQQAQAQAARNAEMAASRAVESPDDEILQSTGAAAARPSEAMGLRSGPAAGTLENAAALSVDTGATAQLQQAAALTQAAELAQEAPQANQKSERAANANKGVDPETGEISGVQSMADWSDVDLSNAFRHAQAKGVRQELARELSRRRAAREQEAQQAQAAAQPDTQAATEATGAQTQISAATAAPGSQAEGASVATLAQLNRKKLAEMSTDELHQLSSLLPSDHSRQIKIQKAIQSRAAQAQTAINEGAITDGTQTPQAQQGSTQSAQAGRAQAGQPAGQGVTHGGPAIGNNGAQAGAQAGSQGQAPAAQAAPNVEQARQIAQDGNAQRDQQRQRLLDASERWTRMTSTERQALAQGLKTMNVLTRKNVHTRPWADLSDKVRGQLADAMNPQNTLQAQADKAPVATETGAKSAPAAQAPVKQEAQSMADAKPFAPETGTLGIPRAEMPQVPAANHGGLVKHLNAQGIAHETKTMDAAELKPTQAEFSPAKVEAAKTAGGDRAVIVSSDGHIIDGHHQAVAAAEEGKQVKAIVLDAPVEKALEAVKTSPSAKEQSNQLDKANESVDGSRYALPKGSIGADWRDAENRSYEHPNFVPSQRQQLLMDEVRKALDTGAFYNDDLRDKVAAALGVSDDVLASNRSNVQGGDFGYDVYHARKVVEAQAQEQDAAKIRAELKLQPGDKLGTLIFNDFKQTNSVEVVSVTEDGRRASFRGKRGAATAMFEATVPTVKFAIERAYEKGKRKDSYEDFIAGQHKNKKPLWERAGPSAPTASEAAPLNPRGQNGEQSISAAIAEGNTAPSAGVAIDSFPVAEAVRSYDGISHSGRSRAEGDKLAFEKFMEAAQAAAEKLAVTESQRAALAAATVNLRADYLRQYRSLMNVRAGTYSAFVAGRGNLNSNQANSRNSALDKAMERFDSWVSDNVDRVSKAVLAARTPEQVKADQAALAAQIQEKADKKVAGLKASLLKFLSFKSGDNLPYGKNAIITRVSYDREGYPSSLTFKMADGSPVTDDKLDLLRTLKERDETLEQAKARIRELVDEVRAENPELTKGAGAIRAAASAKAEKVASESPREAATQATFLDRHNAIEEGISAGTLTLTDYQSAFVELEANQESVMAELNKLTKDKLLRAGGPAFAYRMKDDKKDAIVLAAYQKMLDTYALGRSYGPSSYFLSASAIAKNKADKAQALRDLVSSTTAEDLAARAAEIKAARDEIKAERAAAAEALANPKSLQDYRGFMRHWMDRGETRDQAYLRLSSEQRQQYDALEAAQSKDAREAAKRRALVSVASAGNTTASEVIATKHTKHGHDLFVVQLVERVERDAYDTLNGSAKRLGGSYSSYRGNGAVPGFQFRTREAAEAFQKLVGGDTAQAQELANQRRDAFDDDKSQSAAERLRTMAEALDERASEALGADRKVNTARRARFAASADAAARAQQALAGTMRNIAQAIDAGTAQFLDGVRQKAQVEYLMGQLRTAKSNQLQAKYPDYGERMKRQGEPMDGETVDFAKFPTYEMYRSDWASLARQLLALDGGKKLGATLARVADDVTEAYTSWAKENLLRVSHFGNKVQGGFAEFASKDDAERAIKRSGLVGRAVVLPIKRGQNRVILSPSEAMQQGLWQGDGDKRISIGAEFIEELMKLGKRKGSKELALPWQLESNYENRQRLQRMGILTPAEFRSALRELSSLQQEIATPDRIKELERSMVGRANDGLDFFPTSPAVVQSMLGAAEISEGMAVLEPSAGMGHIADAIVAESGVWPDVVELSASRRELLEAKGYQLADASDFMQMQPRSFYTFGDTFRAPDGVEGIMRGQGGLGSQRVRLEDAEGNRLGLYNRDELVGVGQNGTQSGYDRIIMNPPFSDGRDIQHVMHAYNLLRPGGRIVAIMGEGAFFQSNKRAEAFRDWLDERGATNEKLPDGSFMDPSLPVNTGVAARMVVIDKPAGNMQLAPHTDDDQVHNFAARVQTSSLETFPAEFMAELSAADELFAYPTVHAGSAEAALRQVDPTVKLVGEVTSEDERRESGADAKLLFRTGNGRDFYVFEKGDEFWLDVSRLGEGDGGNAIYAALMDYAATNDKVFIGDPAGLSDIAMRRRLEAMISSAIKRGSTDHMEPHARQVAGDEALGVPALKWRSGDTIGNIQRMIDVSLASISAHVPEFSRARYDFTTGTFRTGAGQPISDGQLNAWAEHPRMRAAGVGRRTIKRGILLNSLLRAESSARPGLLEQALQQPGHLVGEQAKGIFYKLGMGNERRPASAQDKAVMQAIAEGKSARDVLRVVASGSKDPFMRQVARLLLKAGITPNIEFGHIGKSKGNPIHGQYRGKSDTIAIAGSAEYAAERIFMHEAMHAATMRALAKPGLTRLQLQKLAAHVRKQPGAAGFYGISDKNGRVDEFVAEAFTNPDFQAALRTMSAPAGGTIKSAWDGFVRILRSILGLPNDSSNALSQALALGVAAMREDLALRKQGVYSSGSADMSSESNDVQKARVLQGAPVAHLDTAIAPMGAPAIRAWASGLFEQQGGKAHSPVLGDVLLDQRAVRSSIAHGRPNAYKVAAFAAVKDVLEKGALVLYSQHGRDGDSYFVSAPVEIDRTANIVTVLVKRDPNDQRMYLHSVATKESLLNRRVSRTDTENGVERSGSDDAGDTNNVPSQGTIGKASSADVADEINRLLTMDAQDGDVANFGADDFASLKSSALDQIHQTLSHPGKVSLWDKTVGTMRHLAERSAAFKPVYESASQNIEDVSMLANDAADMAPRILPRVDSVGDIFGKNRRKPISAADNKAVAKPLFEGTLIWGRDEAGKPALVDDLQKRYENLSVHNKAAMLLKSNQIDAGVLRMWQGLPVEQYEKLINSRFNSKVLKPGIVWSDSELKSLFGASGAQISLYREARAAIDRSIDMTARTDMLRVVGEKYEGMREIVLAQPTVGAAAQVLLDVLEQDAKADPDSADRLGLYMQQIMNRMEMAQDLQDSGYAPLSRFGKYTVDVVDANGERQYFGMYESKREANLARVALATEFKGATITQGTLSAEAYKMFAGVTPETLEQFGAMLGLKADGNEAQDKAFQEFLKLTKNNHSAMKRLIHRKGIAGFNEDVGRVVANFVYSNARAGAMGLNAGKMDAAINAIPKEQGELRDLSVKLRSYIRDPQEEGQAVRGMLFAQYLGGSIASAFVNTTQPFAVTLPWLSQYGGMAKASAQLSRALKDMATKGFKYESDLAEALQAAEVDGVVSPQEIHQLMAQARGAGMLRSGDGTKAGEARAKAGNLWEQGKVLWGQPFALAEQFNRRSTFIAAYRTAKAQGMADPAGFARHAVLETQFVYSKANKPQWARGAVGGTLFTFKTYSVSYLELMQRMWSQGGPEGKRAVGWAVAMLALMGGAGGLPFMEDAEDLIDGAGQLMGYNISTKQWRKELLASAVGKELADFMEQGISGLPGAPIDVSGRLGMGNLLPGTGLFLNKPNRERDLMEMVGPAGDLVSRGFTGARKALGGDLAGAALEVSPTAVRNAAKGIDMAASGIYKDTKGYKVIDTTLAEAASKFAGFQPKSVAEVQEANSFMQRSKSFYIQQSAEIKAQWADALFRKDEAAVERVRERLAAWNRNNPEQPITVRMPDVWKRVREMGKDRSDRIAATAPKALRQQMREIAQDAKS